MLSTVKALIKMPRIIQLNNRYKKMLDEQYVSYDSWIRQKEEKFLGDISVSAEPGIPKAASINIEQDTSGGKNSESTYATLGVTAMGYHEVSDPPFADKLASTDADIILFTNEADKLDANAAKVVASVFAANPEAILVYGDEDEYNSNETIRMNPIYRPDWSPETLRSYLYMGNAVAVKTSALKSLVNGQTAIITDIYSLIINLTSGKTANEIKHVDYVLYHNNYSKALYLEDNRFAYTYDSDDLISIVIPSKDNPEILKTLLHSMVRLTTGVNYEVIVIDNGSGGENQIKIEQLLKDVHKAARTADSSASEAKSTTLVKGLRYLYRPQEFNFSRICNMGAAEARGKYVLFLNDDMEIRDSKWLLEMVTYAAKEHVGAVGAKLYYPESKMIQHCGITNLRLGPVHKLQYKQDDHVYYDHINDVDRNVLGVTGACLLMRKELFDEIGGFDENFRVAFNDVDLCYTLFERGYSNVVVNTTHLWHYESLSRGDDESREKIERLKGERIKLYEKHPNLYGKDPYYHDYLTGDILDSNFTCAYEYEYDGEGEGKSNILFAKPKKINYAIKPEWENQCLIISLEQCGSLEYWLGPKEASKESKDQIYLGGYSFVAGSDNSCFDFKILLKGESGIYELPCNHLYRPDLEINLDPEENAVLCGFSIRPDTSDMPKGEYQVGVISRGLASRLVLCRFTNRYITIN